MFTTLCSKSVARNFAIAVVLADGGVKHARIDNDYGATPASSGQQARFTLNNRRFASIPDIVEYYIGESLLTVPYRATYLHEQWFQGDLGTDEVEELLTGTAVGTFVVRFDSDHNTTDER